MVFLLLIVGLCSVSVEESLAQAGTTQEEVERLIDQLKDEDVLVRRSAVEALGRIGRGAAPAVEALIETLKDEDVLVRRYAAWALGEIGPEAAPAVEALIEALKDEDDNVRHYAVEALGQIGPAAVAPLIEVLKDEDAGVRGSAIRALSNIGREAAPAVEVLIETLNDEDPYVRGFAARAILYVAESLYDEGETEQLIHFEQAYAIIDENGYLSEGDRKTFERLLIGLRNQKKLDEERLINKMKEVLGTV